MAELLAVGVGWALRGHSGAATLLCFFFHAAAAGLAVFCGALALLHADAAQHLCLIGLLALCAAGHFFGRLALAEAGLYGLGAFALATTGAVHAAVAAFMLGRGFRIVPGRRGCLLCVNGQTGGQREDCNYC